MIRKIKAHQAPKKQRTPVYKFELTEEWRVLKTAIDNGIKPGEAWEIVLTDADKEKYKIKNRRTVARYVRLYIQDKKLPYLVDSFHRANEGDFVIVKRPAALSRSA